MKLFILAATFLISAYAEASFFIICVSTNQWVDSRPQIQPLRAGVAWTVEMKGLGNFKQTSMGLIETYQVTMTKLKNKRIVEGPYRVQGILTQSEGNGYSSLSFSLPNVTSPYENGRFTIKRLAKPYSFDPFVMYGWSKAPLTVASAMYYQCQVEDVY